MSDMAKELEYIASVTAVGDLPRKMEEAEEAKTEVEALIIERVSMILHFHPPLTILLFLRLLMDPVYLFIKMFIVE